MPEVEGVSAEERTLLLDIDGLATWMLGFDDPTEWVDMLSPRLDRLEELD